MYTYIYIYIHKIYTTYDILYCMYNMIYIHPPFFHVPFHVPKVMRAVRILRVIKVLRLVGTVRMAEDWRCC